MAVSSNLAFTSTLREITKQLTVVITEPSPQINIPEVHNWLQVFLVKCSEVLSLHYSSNLAWQIAITQIHRWLWLLWN